MKKTPIIAMCVAQLLPLTWVSAEVTDIQALIDKTSTSVQGESSASSYTSVEVKAYSNTSVVGGQEVESTSNSVVDILVDTEVDGKHAEPVEIHIDSNDYPDGIELHEQTEHSKIDVVVSDAKELTADQAVLEQEVVDSNTEIQEHIDENIQALETLKADVEVTTDVNAVNTEEEAEQRHSYIVSILQTIHSFISSIFSWL